MVNSLLTLRARWIVPGDGPPMQDGRVTLRGDEVLALSTERSAGERDLGDVVLLPGWVNAHTHLEFSDLAARIGRPGMPLAGWLAEVVGHRAAAGSSDERRRAAILRGFEQCRSAGVRLVGEIATEPWEVPEDAGRSADVVALREVLGLSAARQSQTLGWALQAPRPAGGCCWGISPHAPYTAPLPLVERSVAAARERRWPVAMHVAESPDEDRLLAAGDGPLADLLHELGVWQDGWFPSGGDVDDLVRLLGAAPRTLVIHGNYLSDRAIDFLSAQRHATVVYCPRTHAFFGHPEHPVAKLRSAGVRVALGTDSRASNPDLNPWGEVQYLLRHRPDLAPEAVVRMATADAAEALGRPDVGRIRPGCRPGLLRLPTTADRVAGLWEQMRDAESAPTPVAGP